MKNEILEMLEEVCEDEIVKEDLDINLFDTGLIDSLGVTTLIVEIEMRFNISLSPTEIERSQMDTPNKLIALLEEKSSEK
ncbi:D-alanine--poly(phosphoribitol) ligase subunit DltC [Amedibacillus sp. YH-ame10]